MNLPSGYQLETPAAPALPAGYEMEQAPGELASFGRAAANNVPLAPQAIAALEPGAYSQNLAEWNAKAAEAKAAHPISYGAGAVTGALAPLAIPGVGEALAAEPIAGNALLGAANAVSNTDVLQHPGDVLKEAAVGGVTGGALGKGGEMLGDALGAPILKMASYATSPEAVAARLDNPAAFKNAPGVDELSRSLPSIGNKFDQAIGHLSDIAKEKLSTSNYLQQTADDAGGAFTKDEILGVVGNARKSLGGAYGSETQSAANALDKLSDSLTAKRPTVSQNQVHDLIKQLDEEIPWDKVWRSPESLSPTDHALIDARTRFDALLKDKNPGYAAAMKPVAETIQQRNDFIKKFAIQTIKKQGYAPTDATTSKLANALQDNKIDTQRVLDTTKEGIGEDLKPALLAQQFKGPTPESPMGIGSRMGAVAAGAIGGHGLGLAGSGFGAVVGQRILRGPASEFGRKLAGSAVDAIAGDGVRIPQSVTSEVSDYLGSKYGNATGEAEREAAPTVSPDAILQHVMSDPSMSKYRTPMQDAAQRGPQAVVANHFTLMQKDPFYNQAFMQQKYGASIR